MAEVRYRHYGEVRAEQERRRANEAPQVDWNLKRQALIDSGLVAERAKERNADV